MRKPGEFYCASKPVRITGTHLPHWQQGKACLFVTWRLANSLPKTIHRRLEWERNLWLQNNPKPWSLTQENHYHRTFTWRMEKWLDQGGGPQFLREKRFAKVVEEGLHHFDGKRYLLKSFVIMPNHVHALFNPTEGWTLPQIMKSWKGYSAKCINEMLGRKGRFWQRGYWDRLIRHEFHFQRCLKYIKDNPRKAGVSANTSIMYFADDL